MECRPYIQLSVRGTFSREERFFLDVIDNNVVAKTVMEILTQAMERGQSVTLTFVRKCDACGDSYELHKFEADSTDLESALAGINQVTARGLPQMKASLFIVELTDRILDDVFGCLQMYELFGKLVANVSRRGAGSLKKHTLTINTAWKGHQN